MDCAEQTNTLAPCSPDISWLLSFFWDYLKGQVFHLKFYTVVQLHGQMNNAVTSLTHQMQENTWHEVKYCLVIL
jgi:hypothetical protein